MSTINVLVTGGTGFVGSAIVVACVRYVVCDITQEEEIVNVVGKAKPTVVIHTAGIVSQLPDRYDRKAQERVFTINTEGTRRVLAAAKAAGAEAFVLTSSYCCVTDDFRYQYPNVDETWPNFPSIAAAEALVLTASGETFATCAIRPSVLFGQQDYQLIPSIHSCIAKEETPWEIGSSQNLWDVTYVTNVADARVLAAENLNSSKTAAGEAFFISNNEPIPFRSLCLTIWAHFGHYPPFEFHVPESFAGFTGSVAEWMAWLTGTAVTSSGGSVKDACGIRYCNSVKVERILGSLPKVGIEEGIRISCQAYAANLKRDELERFPGLDGSQRSFGDIEALKGRAE